MTCGAPSGPSLSVQTCIKSPALPMDWGVCPVTLGQFSQRGEKRNHALATAPLNKSTATNNS